MEIPFGNSIEILEIAENHGFFPGKSFKVFHFSRWIFYGFLNILMFWKEEMLRFQLVLCLFTKYASLGLRELGFEKPIKNVHFKP